MLVAIIEALIEMKDSLQHMRIQAFLSPFSNSDSVKGLIALTNDIWTRRPTFAFEHLLFLIRIGSSMPLVTKFLEAQRFEMEAFIPLLEDRIRLFSVFAS